jgi:hypothetical protein
MIKLTITNNLWRNNYNARSRRIIHYAIKTVSCKDLIYYLYHARIIGNCKTMFEWWFYKILHWCIIRMAYEYTQNGVSAYTNGVRVYPP